MAQLSEVVLCSLIVISVPIYMTLLLTIYKFRAQEPFRASFFKITFSLGLLDLLHLTQAWLLNKFPNFGWFFMNDLVMLAPDFFAKLSSMIWWFAALGQTLTVLLMAVNRVSVIALKKFQPWSTTFERTLLIGSWVLPLFLVTPQLGLNFGYHRINGSDGVTLYWADRHLQQFYYNCCFWWCGVLAAIMAILYLYTYYKVRQQRLNVERVSRSQRHRREGELRLVLVGVTLFVLRLCCSIYCGAMSLSSDPKTHLLLLQFDHVLGDLNSLVSPTLLLICSKPTRRAMVRFITCSKDKSTLFSLSPTNILSTQELSRTVSPNENESQIQCLSLQTVTEE